MNRSALFSLVLTGMVVMAMQRANASSAVAVDREFHVTRAYDPTASEEEVKQRALELAVHHGWTNARIVASTGRYGYCAVALAYKAKGTGAIMGIALGSPSQAEADRLAIASCLKAGGFEPKVYARFKG
jgi:ubiquinone biosynthesis protein COQ9